MLQRRPNSSAYGCRKYKHGGHTGEGARVHYQTAEGMMGWMQQVMHVCWLPVGQNLHCCKGCSDQTFQGHVQVTPSSRCAKQEWDEAAVPVNVET